MANFFNKFKKPFTGPFLVYFPNFWGRFFFPENPVLSRTTSYGHVHLIIAVLGLYVTSTHPTTSNKFEENHSKAILSYSIDG